MAISTIMKNIASRAVVVTTVFTTVLLFAVVILNAFAAASGTTTSELAGCSASPVEDSSQAQIDTRDGETVEMKNSNETVSPIGFGSLLQRELGTGQSPACSLFSRLDFSQQIPL